MCLERAAHGNATASSTRRLLPHRGMAQPLRAWRARTIGPLRLSRPPKHGTPTSLPCLSGSPRLGEADPGLAQTMTGARDPDAGSPVAVARVRLGPQRDLHGDRLEPGPGHGFHLVGAVPLFREERP